MAPAAPDYKTRTEKKKISLELISVTICASLYVLLVCLESAFLTLSGLLALRGKSGTAADASVSIPEAKKPSSASVLPSTS